MWFKRNKWKITVPLLIVLVLAAAFYFGGDTSGSKATAAVTPENTAEVSPYPVITASPAEQTSVQGSDKPVEDNAAAPSDAPVSPAVDKSEETTPDVSAEPVVTPAPVPEDNPKPTEPQDVTVGSVSHSCTISISCVTILDNLDLCAAEKRELVPDDGWILKPVTVTFYEGESVFNVLQRTCKQNKIHMEFSDTPIYNSAYIEGIYNLYEFDVGELSGWMYKVNDWFPNYGCSRYQLSDGDVICWVYTCDLGEDVGGGYSAGN